MRNAEQWTHPLENVIVPLKQTEKNEVIEHFTSHLMMWFHFRPQMRFLKIKHMN